MLKSLWTREIQLKAISSKINSMSQTKCQTRCQALFQIKIVAIILIRLELYYNKQVAVQAIQIRSWR
jgi:hypothetical protein